MFSKALVFLYKMKSMAGHEAVSISNQCWQWNLGNLVRTAPVKRYSLLVSRNA